MRDTHSIYGSVSRATQSQIYRASSLRSRSIRQRAARYCSPAQNHVVVVNVDSLAGDDAVTKELSVHGHVVSVEVQLGGNYVCLLSTG